MTVRKVKKTKTLNKKNATRKTTSAPGPSDNDIEQEVEAKFLMEPCEADKFLRSGFVQRIRIEEPSRGLECSTYFDTPRQLLKKRGISLRIRQKDGGYTQTLKSEGRFDQGILTRLETSRAVSSLDINRSMVAAVLKEQSLPVRNLSRLVPVFRTDVERTRFLVKFGKSKIELAYDHGGIICPKTGRRLEKISEIEAELKSGTARDMFLLLCELNERFHVQQFATSKAARGFAAANRRNAFKSVKHKRFATEGSNESFMLLQQSMGATLSHFFANNPNFIRHKPEAIHQTRVAVRRMRAILQAFKEAIGYLDRKALNGELRWFQNKLGECRDWHVLADDTAPVLAKQHPEAAATLRRLARKAHNARLPEAMEIYNSRRAQRLILNIQLWLSGLPESGGRTIAALRKESIRRNLKRLSAMGRLSSRSPVQKIHAVRILSKKMRYTLEILPGTGLADGNALKALTDLQDHLGNLNDASKCLELISNTREAELPSNVHETIRHWAELRMAKCLADARPSLTRVRRWGRRFL